MSLKFFCQAILFVRMSSAVNVPLPWPAGTNALPSRCCPVAYGCSLPPVKSAAWLTPQTESKFVVGVNDDGGQFVPPSVRGFASAGCFRLYVEKIFPWFD